MDRNLPAPRPEGALVEADERPALNTPRPVSVALLPLALIAFIILAFTIAAWTFLSATL